MPRGVGIVTKSRDLKPSQARARPLPQTPKTLRVIPPPRNQRQQGKGLQGTHHKPLTRKKWWAVGEHTSRLQCIHT